jgi:hypothetical protein
VSECNANLERDATQPHCAILYASSWQEDTVKEGEVFNKWLPLRQLTYHDTESPEPPVENVTGAEPHATMPAP